MEEALGRGQARRENTQGSCEGKGVRWRWRR